MAAGNPYVDAVQRRLGSFQPGQGANQFSTLGQAGPSIQPPQTTGAPGGAVDPMNGIGSVAPTMPNLNPPQGPQAAQFPGFMAPRPFHPMQPYPGVNVDLQGHITGPDQQEHNAAAVQRAVAASGQGNGNGQGNGQGNNQGQNQGPGKDNDGGGKGHEGKDQPGDNVDIHGNKDFWSGLSDHQINQIAKDPTFLDLIRNLNLARDLEKDQFKANKGDVRDQYGATMRPLKTARDSAEEQLSSSLASSGLYGSTSGGLMDQDIIQNFRDSRYGAQTARDSSILGLQQGHDTFGSQYQMQISQARADALNRLRAARLGTVA